MLIPPHNPNTTETETETDLSMDFGEERSSRGGTSSSLHNFSSLPSWGTRKQFRCVKPSELTPYSLSPNRRFSDDDDGGIEAVRVKLMIDFRAQVDKLQSEFFNHGKNSAPPVTVAETAEEVVPRPSNFRTTRAVCEDPNNNGTNNVSGKANSPARSGRGDGNGEEKAKKRAKFSISLSKSKIEADFIALTGARPARRPKKRAKLIQTNVDKMLPGFLSTEITADMYKVNEQIPASRKKY